jgi:ActR/RegA family two-component response regulator
LRPRKTNEIIKADLMNPTRVLIIDEDPEFSYTLKRMLEEGGVEAEIARSRIAVMETLMYSPIGSALPAVFNS